MLTASTAALVRSEFITGLSFNVEPLSVIRFTRKIDKKNRNILIVLMRKMLLNIRFKE